MNGSSRIRHLSELPCKRDWKLDDSGWSDQAWMSNVDLKIIETTLSRLAAEDKSGVSCFEWGSGRSSLHFSEQIKRADTRSVWISIEYNREWFDVFRAEFDGRAEHFVYYMDDEPIAEMSKVGTNFLIYDYGELLPMHEEFSQHRGVEMNDYVNSIGLFDSPFDFVLVDGRKRNQCLFAASQRLSDHGIVFLHDAWRPYYAFGGTFFRTALRAGENLMVASHMSLPDLLRFVDISDLCTESQIQWTREV